MNILVMAAMVLWCGRAAGSWFGITGSVGTYGEAYHMSGREARRDPTTGRLYFRPVVTVLGMSFPFEVLVSTEETRFRQPFNRFGINPKWKWITLHLGDFTSTISPYTLSGTRLRGGGMELRPGALRFSFAGGRSQRAIPGRAYEREVWALGFGIGRTWDISLLWASDDTSSVDSATVPPQQNLVVASRLHLRLLRGKLSLGAEGAGSMHTRDMRSSSADSIVKENLPGGIYSLVRHLNPRLSTRVDYAYKLKLGLRLKPGNFSAEYSRVGPGFVSLGVPYVGNDRKQLSLGLDLRPVRGLSLGLRYSGYGDNLSGEKRTTTERRSFSSSARAKVGPFGTGVSFGWSGLVRKDTVRSESESLRYGADGWYRFEAMGIPQTLRASYSLSRSGRKGGKYKVANASLRWDVRKSQNLSGGISFGMVSSEGRSYNLSLSVNHRAMKQRLTNSLGLNFRFGKGYTSVSSSLSSRLSVTPSDLLSFSLRRTDCLRSGGSYHETTASLSFDHRFRIAGP